jgi:hypothetical protein
MLALPVGMAVRFTIRAWPPDAISTMNGFAAAAARPRTPEAQSRLEEWMNSRPKKQGE